MVLNHLNLNGRTVKEKSGNGSVLYSEVSEYLE